MPDHRRADDLQNECRDRSRGSAQADRALEPGRQRHHEDPERERQRDAARAARAEEKER
jgi:hypothetical protein